MNTKNQQERKDDEDMTELEITLTPEQYEEVKILAKIYNLSIEDYAYQAALDKLPPLDFNVSSEVFQELFANFKKALQNMGDVMKQKQISADMSAETKDLFQENLDLHEEIVKKIRVLQNLLPKSL